MFVELMTCLMFVLQGLYSVCGAHALLYVCFYRGCIVSMDPMTCLMFISQGLYSVCGAPVLFDVCFTGAV